MTSFERFIDRYSLQVIITREHRDWGSQWCAILDDGWDLDLAPYSITKPHACSNTVEGAVKRLADKLQGVVIRKQNTRVLCDFVRGTNDNVV